MNRSDMRKEISSVGTGRKDAKPPSSKREAADPVDPSAISEDLEETGPAHKVEHGRPEPSGKTPRAGGSIMGSGEDSEIEPGETTMSTSSRDKAPSIGGSHMGNANATHGMTGPKSFGGK